MTTLTHDAPRPASAPERSLTQRLDALERANEVRTKRAALKRDVKGGRRSIHELLMDPPAYIETAKVFDMLLVVPKYGRVKTNKVLTQCRISPSKTIGGLSQRQRDELVSMLRPGAAPRIDRPGRPPLYHVMATHLATGEGDMRATFCGHTLHRRYTTTSTDDVTCGSCRTVAAARERTAR